MVLSIAAASALLGGCVCGAAAVPTGPGGDKGAIVDKKGVVVFEHTEIGDTVSFDVPIHDSADVDEVLMGATISGADADEFEVHGSFPIEMNAGDIVHIGVDFHPTRSGKVDVELMVQTKEMGVSPIEVTGVGIDPTGR